MSFFDDLVLLTSPVNFADEHVLIERIFESGLKRLHLRKPGFSVEKLDTWLLGLDISYRKRCVLHGDLETALALEVGGVHSSPQFATNLTKASLENLDLSVSCHSFEEIKALPTFVDYAFLSPIFDSISKVNYKAAFTKTQIQEFFTNRDSTQPRIYALGGIDIDTIEEAKKCGFDSAAVLGGVWNYANPMRAWLQLSQGYL